jgi:hypothetical protein
MPPGAGNLSPFFQLNNAIGQMKIAVIVGDRQNGFPSAFSAGNSSR